MAQARGGQGVSLRVRPADLCSAASVADGTVAHAVEVDVREGVKGTSELKLAH